MIINPRNLKSSHSFYIKLTLEQLNSYDSKTYLENIALVQNLPSGWEIENTRLNLSNIYEGYNYITENNLFLNEFIEDYNNSKNAIREENDNEIILTTNCRNSENRYQTNKILTIDKQTNKPKKMEVQDVNKNTTVYILYNEISYK